MAAQKPLFEAILYHPCVSGRPPGALRSAPTALRGAKGLPTLSCLHPAVKGQLSLA